MDDATVKEVFDTLNDQQKELVYALVGAEAMRNKEFEKELKRLRKEVRKHKKLYDAMQNLKEQLQLFTFKEEE